MRILCRGSYFSNPRTLHHESVQSQFGGADPASAGVERVWREFRYLIQMRGQDEGSILANWQAVSGPSEKFDKVTAMRRIFNPRCRIGKVSELQPLNRRLRGWVVSA